jgi:hypothetical protein
MEGDVIRKRTQNDFLTIKGREWPPAKWNAVGRRPTACNVASNNNAGQKVRTNPAFLLNHPSISVTLSIPPLLVSPPTPARSM